MNGRWKTLGNVAAILALGALVGCGGPVAMAELPVFPGAAELKADDSAIGTTLENNMGADAAIRNSAGIGGKTEQKGFRLPANANWAEVKSFFGEKLKASGWDTGMGPAGAMVGNVMETANASNPLFQTMLWTRDKQTLTVTMLANPSKAGEKALILSLSSY